VISLLLDLCRGRCPRCRKGSIFQPNLVGKIGFMNEKCSVCGLRFLREAGYFLGAMYISYTLGAFTVLPVAIYLAVVPQWPLVVILLIALVQTIVSMPLFLRYSRVIWLYADQALDPR
jgi:uncharacterized protein (DUF983 family)